MNKLIKSLWEQYKKTKSIVLRNILVEEHLSFAKYQTNRVFYNTPDEVDYDTLYSDALMGLIKAVEKFDINRGLKFSTYAWYVIHGAMIDGLRERDYVPRTERSNHTKFCKKIEAITQNLGYRPSEEELRKRMQISREKFAAGNMLVGKISLDVEKYSEDGPSIKDELVDNTTKRMSRKEFSAGRWMSGLLREEKLILTLYYYDNMFMKEISETIGISESRVSQIHKNLLEKFRGQYDKTWAKI